MKMEPREISLRDGRRCVLRSAGPGDAAAVLRLLRRLAGETEFLARSPEDPLMPEEKEREFLAGRLAAADGFLLVAEVAGELAGNAGLDGVSRLVKFRHRASMGIAVRQAYWGLGIGTALMTEVIARAKQAGYSQLELEVSVKNGRAVALYRRFGFEIYGTRPSSLHYSDGSFGAEHMMLRRL